MVYDVDAAVMPDSALGVNLLGMTFLTKVNFAHDHGRLVLEQ
jgi:predicted aspartyl protease